MSDRIDFQDAHVPPLTGKPFLVVNVVWHPDFKDGEKLATRLYSFYRRDYLSNVGAGAGIPVLYLTPTPESALPAVRTDNAEETATILLVDDCWMTDDAWLAWTHELEKATKASGLRSRIFPVAVSKDATQIGLVTEAVLWFEWAELEFEERFRRLTTDLSHQFCRMLRHWLNERTSPENPTAQRRKYREPVKLFVSHTKRDEEGTSQRPSDSTFFASRDSHLFLMFTISRQGSSSIPRFSRTSGTAR